MSNEINFACEKEKIQRKKIKELTLFSDYISIFSDGEYDRTDGYILDFLHEKRYEIETKWYGDEKNKRNSTKFPDYQIDFEKIENLEKKAQENNSIPLLIVFFSNELIVWNTRKCDWKSTKKMVKTNKYGGRYGAEKENTIQVFFNFSDAIYRNEKITPFS